MECGMKNWRFSINISINFENFPPRGLNVIPQKLIKSVRVFIRRNNQKSHDAEKVAIRR